MLLVSLHVAAEQRDDLLGRGHRIENLSYVDHIISESRLNEAKIQPSQLEPPVEPSRRHGSFGGAVRSRTARSKLR